MTSKWMMVFLFGVENVFQIFKILIFKWVNYVRCEFYLGNVSVLKVQEVGWGLSSVGEGQTRGPGFGPRTHIKRSWL